MCSFLVWKDACLNYREFDLEGDLVGVPNTWYLSVQSFIRLLKLVSREYDIVAMNEWKKKCVGLQRTWVSKRTVYICRINLVWRDLLCFIIFHSHVECICRWKFIKNKKREKWNMPITKTNQVQLFWKDNQNLTFHCEFDLEGDLVGVPHTRYLSDQSFITVLKLVWRE